MMRVLEKPDPGRIIVFKEKHGNHYFLASTREELCEVALTVLKSRIKERWYSAPEKKPYFYPEEIEEALTLTDEQIAAIPTEDLRKKAASQRSKARQAVREHENEQELWARMQTAIKTKDGMLAWDVLDERSNWEYEGYSFEYLENVRK